jgi:hypothetical protein
MLSRALRRNRRRLKEIFEQAPAGLDLSWILELVDKMISSAIFGFEVFGKHLPS